MEKFFGEETRLTEKLKEVFTETATSEPKHLKTLLLLIARNASSDSVWPITSNPDAKYNLLERLDCNLKLPIWKVVRAKRGGQSTLHMKRFRFASDDQPIEMIFVDAHHRLQQPGILPGPNGHGAMLPIAVHAVKVNLLISIGTGQIPSVQLGVRTNIASAALSTLRALLYQTSYDQDLNCRLRGRCSYGGHLDQEVGDLIPRRSIHDVDSELIPLDEDLGRDFLYARYNVDLTTAGLSDLSAQ